MQTENLHFVDQQEILFPDEYIKWGDSKIGLTVEEEREDRDLQWHQILPKKAQVHSRNNITRQTHGHRKQCLLHDLKILRLTPDFESLHLMPSFEIARRMQCFKIMH